MINIEEMREFTRYSTDIAIECRTANGQHVNNPHIQNISGNGLNFTANTKIDPASDIYIVIPLNEKQFQVKGSVAWCMDMESHFEMGVRVDLKSPETDARNFEILCDVEHYRQQVVEKEGRELSTGEAAGEWIAKFGGGLKE